MNWSIALIATLVMAAGLTGCTFFGDDSPPEIYAPGSSVTVDPPAPIHHAPVCRVPNMCPR